MRRCYRCDLAGPVWARKSDTVDGMAMLEAIAREKQAEKRRRHSTLQLIEAS
jgi:hypothetical protein